MPPSTNLSYRRARTGSSTSTLEDLVLRSVKDIKKKSNITVISNSSDRKDRSRHGNSDDPCSPTRSSSRRRAGSHTGSKRQGRRVDDGPYKDVNAAVVSNDRPSKKLDIQEDNEQQKNVYRSPRPNRSFLTTLTMPVSPISPPLSPLVRSSSITCSSTSVPTSSPSPMKRIKKLLQAGFGSGAPPKTPTSPRTTRTVDAAAEKSPKVLDKPQSFVLDRGGTPKSKQGRLRSLSSSPTTTTTPTTSSSRRQRQSSGTSRTPETALKMTVNKKIRTPASYCSHKKSITKSPFPPLPLTSAHSFHTRSSIGKDKEQKKNLPTKRLKTHKKQLDEYDQPIKHKKPNGEKPTSIRSPKKSNRDLFHRQPQLDVRGGGGQIEVPDHGSKAASSVHLEYQLEETRRLSMQKDDLLKAQMANLVLQSDLIKALELQLAKLYQETLPDLRAEIQQLTVEKAKLVEQRKRERLEYVLCLQHKDEKLLDFQEEMKRLRAGLGISSHHSSTTTTTIGSSGSRTTEQKIQRAMSCFSSS